MPYIQNGPADVWYDELGSGEPVLLIHGGLLEPMSGERFWVRTGIVDELAASGHRAIVPDRRYGGGQTSAPFQVYTWEVDASDMAAVVRTAASERVHVVAGSNGCSTAVRLALEYPDQLRSLTLCWPATPDNNGFRAEFEAAAAAIEAIGPRAYLDRVRGAGVVSPRKEESRFPWSHALLEDERLDRSFRDLTGDMAADVVRTTAAALLADGLIRGVSSDDATRLGLIGIPVAVMPPDPEDLFHASETAQALLEAVPNAHACPEMPIPLSNEFRPARIAYVEALRAVFSSARQPHPASP